LGDVYFLVLPLILNFFHIPLILFYHCILTNLWSKSGTIKRGNNSS
jgi:hypothetical protein